MKKTKLRGSSLNHPLKKILLTMRIVFALLVLGIVQAHATDAYSQKTRLSLNVTDAQLVTVLDKIEDETEFFFLYNEKLLDTERKVSITADNQVIDVILDRLFAGTDVTHTIIDRKIILAPVYLTEVSGMQQARVTGKVTSTKGEPLPGVTVTVRGKIQGTATDMDGSFSLDNVMSTDVLVFSFIGMKNMVVPVGSQTYFEVVLAEELIGMDAVIVTALGIKREEKALGYAVQKVTGDAVTTVKGIDVGTSLTGKVAGLMVRNSSEFTAEPQILLRGETPLIVIDGVPYGNMSLRDIPSDDIEDISVLKGSTASALYGYRGGSGAIMITTKRGGAAKGLTVSVNSNSMFTAGFLAIPERQSTYGRVVNTTTNTYVRSGDGAWGAPLEGQTVIQWDPASKTMTEMPYLARGKDNFSNFLEQGYILNNNVNLAQQSEYGNIRSSVSWVENKGIYPNSQFQKLTYSLGGDMKIDKFTLSSGVAYNKHSSPNVGFSGYTGYDPMYALLIWSAPDWDIRDYQDYWVVPNEVQNSSYTAGNNNPYFDRYERLHSVNKDIFNGTLALTYDFNQWLTATIRTGYDTYSNKQDITVSKGSFQGAGNGTVIPGGTEVWGESQKGSYNIGLARGFSLNNDLIVSANQKINDFTLDGFVGGSVYYWQDEGIEARTRGGLSIPAFYSLKASIDPVLTASRLYKRQVNSLYGRVGFAYKSIAFVEATLRNDWVSTLSESTRSYAYPSVSASFIISEVLPDIDWLSLWKLRGSWVTVKTPADVYQINSVFSISNNAWGTLSSATYPTTIRGTDVLPESASTFEIGTVVNLYNNRASVDLTYYSKRMFDFLRSTGISPTSGYNSRYINIDEEITRRGVELTLNGTPVKTSDWQWDVSLNWSKYARYYTKLDSLYSADKPWVAVGARADAYVLRDYLKDPAGNIIHNASGLPLYSSYDSKYGNADPDWIWGLSSMLKYKDFSLSVSVDGRVGGLAQTITEMYMWRSGNHPLSVVPERYLDATVAGSKNYLGQGVKIVEGTVTYDTYGNITSDTRVFAVNDVATTYKSYIEAYHKGTAWGGSPSPVDLYDATFFKIREVALTYKLPKELASKIRARELAVSAVGQNVFLWAKQFKYSDPDGGSENFLDPSLRYLGLNLKIGF
ncbi:MAG: SusC/RagA family TonB-linked outer membrane protein [Bacteroidales bacterium]|nr:SusC/RagA family TonB-linked outer membrane protein [Bacteroidales bacterium]